MQATHEPTQTDVIKALMVMATIYEKALTEEAADMLVNDLAEYEPARILRALKICRIELNRFPTLAEIVKRTSTQSDSGQAHDIVGNIFKAISWHGYNNPQAARSMIGEVGWKAVQFMGGWQYLCDTPSDDLHILRAQLKKSVESALEEKARCDMIGIPFKEHGPGKVIAFSNKPPMQKLDFSNFNPEGDPA